METKRRSLVGVVVGDKMEKTAVVAVEVRRRHPLYGKIMRRQVRIKAHDEAKECGVGDKVVVVESRPFSKTKRWRVAQILAKAEAEEVLIDDTAVQ